jgi:hypothetical protein
LLLFFSLPLFINETTAEGILGTEFFIWHRETFDLWDAAAQRDAICSAMQGWRAERARDGQRQRAGPSPTKRSKPWQAAGHRQAARRRRSKPRPTTTAPAASACRSCRFSTRPAGRPASIRSDPSIILLLLLPRPCTMHVASGVRSGAPACLPALFLRSTPPSRSY